MNGRSRPGIQVRQTFVNQGSDALEVMYIFPLPPRAAVSRFSAVLGTRKVVGVLAEREAARQSYENAIEQGSRAALAEAERDDVFTTTLGNLQPGEEAEIELYFTGPLSVEEGEATFRLPLVVAPRYTTGNALTVRAAGSGDGTDTDAVPDATRLNPPRLVEGEARPKFTCSIAFYVPGVGPRDVRSSLHGTIVQGDSALGREFVNPMPTTENGDSERSDSPFTVTLEPGEQLDRDIILRFPLPRKLETSAAFQDDPESQEDQDTVNGTFSVTICAPPARRRPVAIVVLLDHSGSMGGWKIAACRRAASRIVDTLDDKDSFGVIAFDHRVTRLTGASLLQATDRNRYAAVRSIGKLEAEGGTEIGDGLRAAGELLKTAAFTADSVVVLVTDGQIAGEDSVLSSAREYLAGITIHTVGIDRSVAAGFLEHVAAIYRGTCTLAESENQLGAALKRIQRRIFGPGLTDVQVASPDVDILEDEFTPVESVDVFDGVPYMVRGRYRRNKSNRTAPVNVELTGMRSSGRKWRRQVVAENLGASPARIAHAPQPPPLLYTEWVRGRLHDLDESYRAGGYDSLRERIVRPSLSAGVLSRFTAFVAIDEELVGKNDLRSVIQPVELPSGWEAVSCRSSSVPPLTQNQQIGSYSAAAASVQSGGAALSAQAVYVAGQDDQGNYASSGTGTADIGGWASTGPTSNPLGDRNPLVSSEALTPWPRDAVLAFVKAVEAEVRGRNRGKELERLLAGVKKTLLNNPHTPVPVRRALQRLIWAVQDYLDNVGSDSELERQCVVLTQTVAFYGKGLPVIYS